MENVEQAVSPTEITQEAVDKLKADLVTIYSAMGYFIQKCKETNKTRESKKQCLHFVENMLNELRS